MNTQDLKDRGWSAASGFFVAVSIVIAIVGTPLVAPFANIGVAAAVSVAVAAISVAVAVGANVAVKKADKFRSVSAVGGFALPLATIFGSIDNYKGFDKLEIGMTKQLSLVKSHASECGNIVATFNENNDNKNVKASIDDNGQYVLTVSSDKSDIYPKMITLT